MHLTELSRHDNISVENKRLFKTLKAKLHPDFKANMQIIPNENGGYAKISDEEAQIFVFPGDNIKIVMRIKGKERRVEVNKDDIENAKEIINNCMEMSTLSEE